MAGLSGSPKAAQLNGSDVSLVAFARRACGLADCLEQSTPESGSPAVALVINRAGFIADVVVNEDAWELRERVGASHEGHLIEGDLLMPGFVDIHTHGLGGADDATGYWKNPDFTQKHLASVGTTSFLASLVFPDDGMKTVNEILSCLVPRIGSLGHGAVLEGIHAEGPYVKDLGAMPEGGTLMTVDELDAWIDSLPPATVRMMTISPSVEAQCNYQHMKCLLKHSILPALGHDRSASEKAILGALQCCPGKQLHITHLYNVTGFHHRLPSLVNFGIAEKFPNLPEYKGLLPPTVELIGDLAHVHPLTIQSTLASRSCRNVAFISDAISAPLPGSKTAYAGRQLHVGEDGTTVKLLGTDTLAGSCATLLTTFKNLVSVIGASEEDASTMLSTTPARIVGLDDIGRIQKGCRADFVLLNDNYDLQYTVIGGKAAFSRREQLP